MYKTLQDAVLYHFRVSEREQKHEYKYSFLCNAVSESSESSMKSYQIKKLILEDVEIANGTTGLSQFPRDPRRIAEAQLQVAMYGLLLAEYIRTDYA